MVPRQVDLEFGHEEKLWRRIERGDLDAQKRLKAQRFRLQISVVREKHGTRESATFDKWNGIAEATAASVAGLSVSSVRVECVDEPLPDGGDGHALIAMILTPGVPLDPHAIGALRLKLAEAFTVALPPT